MTLLSLLKQSLPATEVIVVDDCSTDDTENFLNRDFPSVRVIHLQQNSGPGAARNRGLRESSGEFIHFFDSDDVAALNKHEVQIAALEESGADIAYGPWIKGAISDASIATSSVVIQQNGIPKGDLVKALLTSWSIVPHACLFRREIVEKSGGFPEELRVAEDQFMFLKCLLAGAKVVHSPGTLELYRVDNPDKITASSTTPNSRNITDWGKFLLMANEACSKQNIHPIKWKGFRQRVWQAKKDLESLTDFDVEIVRSLDELIKGYESDAVFQRRKWINEKRAGLRQRFTNSRWPNSFRSGPLNKHQQRMIDELDFHV